MFLNDSHMVPSSKNYYNYYYEVITTTAQPHSVKPHLRDHSFSTYVKVSEKVTFLTP